MENFNCPIIQDDLSYLTNRFRYMQEKISNKTILITGATGLIGHFIVLTLMAMQKSYKMPLKIIAHGRSIRKLQDSFRDHLNHESLVLSDLSYDRLCDKFEKIDFILHAASPTSSKEFIQKPIEVMDSILFGTREILNVAKYFNITSMVYLSSMEVYGRVLESKRLLEPDIGYLDLQALRSSYPESKRAAELLCVAAFHEWGIPVKIARLSMVFGPGVSPSDKRVLNYITQQVKRKEPIQLLTKGGSRSPVLYLRDAVEAIFFLLFSGSNGDTYNVANPENYYSIYEMARIAASLSDVSVELPQDNDDLAQYPRQTYLNLDITHISNLGWSPSVGLREIFERTIKSQEF